MSHGIAFYNNWQQHSEFIILSLTCQWDEDGMFHIGAGFLGIGFELFFITSNQP